MKHAPANESDYVSNARGVMHLLTTFDEFFARQYHELTPLTPCTIPPHGPAILVCNHTAGLDPVLIQSVCPRIVVWMMASEYYDLRTIRWVFRAVQAIPVDRDGKDLAATRAGLRALKDRRVLGVFPEGRIETGRELLEFQVGVALLAIKSGAPVYPAYLDGTQRGREMAASVFRPCRATIAFGPEVKFDRADVSRENLTAATAIIRRALEALKAFSERAAGSAKWGGA